MTIRILIADDHGVMRAGLRALLETDHTIEVVGEAADGVEVLHKVGQLLPNVILLDIGMPNLDGIETTRHVKTLYPSIQVLLLTVYEEESFLREAIKVGASGYIIKRAAETELLAAIKAVSQGYMYIHPAITHLLVQDLSPNVDHKKEVLDTLTPREYEIMRYIVRGYTNREIAETLNISTRTVEGHRASLFMKLGLKNRVELVSFVEKHNLK